MTHYLVTAEPEKEVMEELKSRLDSGEIAKMRPFGSEMSQALKRARVNEEGLATWEEICYCPTPLLQEREVLDRYFSNIETEVVESGVGWKAVESMPSMWDD
ncbi:MAG: hypothetical protein ACE5KH_01520 [Candidatus Geothermarchaeales archaeon]